MCLLSAADYCNDAFTGLSKKSIRHLQLVLTNAKKVEHITLVLVSLRWLPVFQRMDSKIQLFVYKALNTSLIYWQVTKHPDPSGHLEQVYSVFPGPKLTEVLPTCGTSFLRSAKTLSSFKSEIKTLLFSVAFLQITYSSIFICNYLLACFHLYCL